jgi:hypothetical protein
MTEAAAAQAGTEQQTQETSTTAPAANQSWYNDLPSEDQTYLAAKGWNKPDAKEAIPHIFKSAREAERMISTIKGSPERIIVTPKDMTNADEVKSYYSKIGVPENLEGYELGEMDDMLKGFAEESLKAGAPKAAVQKQVEFYKRYTAERAEKEEAAFREAGTKELEQYMASLGPNLNLETKFFAAGKQAFPELSGEKSVQLEKLLGVKDYAVLMSKLGRLSGEDTTLGIGSAEATANRNSETQLAQFKMDESRMRILADTSHPNHTATLSEWNRLHKQLYD